MSKEQNPLGHYESYADYIKYKVLCSSVGGGLYGTSIGYLLGDMAVLYGYTYGIGIGFVTWGFYSTAYASSLIRQKDDIFNHTISGALCGGLFGSSMYGTKRAPLALLGGAALGAGMKVIGDIWYEKARVSWINARIYQNEVSKPKTILVRRLSFPPKEKRTIISNKAIDQKNEEAKSE